MDYVALAVAALSFLAVILHAFGKSHPRAEAIADVIDEVEKELPKS